MSIRPAALHRAGMQAAGIRLTCASLTALLLAVGMPHSASAEGAKDVITKMLGVYSAAKSYQASVTVKQSGVGPDGKSVSITAVQKIKFKGPNLLNVQVAATGTGAAAAPIAKQGNVQTTSDGKFIYVYPVAPKQYAKQPAPPAITLAQLLRLPQDIGNPEQPTTTTVKGRAAYVLNGTPAPPANLTADQKKQFETQAKNVKLRLVIDKQNYQLLQMNTTSGKNMMTMDLDSQVIGGSVSGFTFTPPAGSKEFTQPAMGPGGVPGGIPNPHGGAPGGVPKK